MAHPGLDLSAINYPSSATPHGFLARFIADNKKIGTGTHKMNANLLTNDSAPLEKLENVMGCALAAANAAGPAASPRAKHIYETRLKDIGGKVYTVSWSDTNIEDKRFAEIYDTRPQDGAEKPHENHVFNSGQELAHEKETGGEGDQYILVQHTNNDGTTVTPLALRRSLDAAQQSATVRTCAAFGT